MKRSLLSCLNILDSESVHSSGALDLPLGALQDPVMLSLPEMGLINLDLLDQQVFLMTLLCIFDHEQNEYFSQRGLY